MKSASFDISACGATDPASCPWPCRGCLGQLSGLPHAAGQAPPDWGCRGRAALVGPCRARLSSANASKCVKKATCILHADTKGRWAWTQGPCASHVHQNNGSPRVTRGPGKPHQACWGLLGNGPRGPCIDAPRSRCEPAKALWCRFGAHECPVQADLVGKVLPPTLLASWRPRSNMPCCLASRQQVFINVQSRPGPRHGV